MLPAPGPRSIKCPRYGRRSTRAQAKNPASRGPSSWFLGLRSMRGPAVACSPGLPCRRIFDPSPVCLVGPMQNATQMGWASGWGCDGAAMGLRSHLLTRGPGRTWADSRLAPRRLHAPYLSTRRASWMFFGVPGCPWLSLVVPSWPLQQPRRTKRLLHSAICHKNTGPSTLEWKVVRD